jgi:hypothetical protein
VPLYCSGMKENQDSTAVDEAAPLSVAEFAKRLGLNRTSAYKLVAHEPGVLRIHTTGSKKPIVRVPLAVLDLHRNHMSTPFIFERIFVGRFHDVGEPFLAFRHPARIVPPHHFGRVADQLGYVVD